MQALRLLARGLQRVCEEPEDLDSRLDCQLGMTIAVAGPIAGGGAVRAMRSGMCWAAKAACRMGSQPASCCRA